MYMTNETSSKKLFCMVEGNIGTGKSTFIRIITSLLEAAHGSYEPLEEWQNVGGENLLNYFYQEPMRWAYSFQTYTLLTRARLAEAVKKRPEPLQFLERSIYSDRYCFAQACFELGFFQHMEWQLYQEWFSWIQEHMQLPSAFIYLRTDPAVSYARLVKRSRSEEAGVSLDYITFIYQKHENWLIKKEGILPVLKQVPVLVLACDEDFEHNKDVQEAHIKSIIDFLYEHFGFLALKKA